MALLEELGLNLAICKMVVVVAVVVVLVAVVFYMQVLNLSMERYAFCGCHNHMAMFPNNVIKQGSDPKQW